MVSYLVIELFFDDYYYSRQTLVLKEKTLDLVDVLENSGLNDFLVMAEELKTERGMSIHLYSPRDNLLYGSDVQGSGRQGLMDIFNTNESDTVFISSTGGQNSRLNWLTYVYETDGGYLVMSRISYSNMESVVGIVQQFFLLFGVFLALIFMFFAFFFSRSMSKPLRKLNEIAEGMARLDFTLKYTGTRKDEIGKLGQTLNLLTANLENTISQLRTELDKEKTLEKMRTGFTAQVSHELQTPLSVIRGYAEALADRIYETNETDEVYEIMLQETNRISRLVDDLLDLSQMESGAYVIRKKSFSLSELMDKLFQTHKRLPNTKAFKFEFINECSKSTLFFGDPLRLEQALRNTIGNAIKYVSENGKIVFTLSEGQNSCIIKIFNSGSHIPEDDINEIFNSYYQGKNHKQGTGLGLAITRHIIELHGGTISAVNQEDGVELIIELPNTK
jgi:signal transduction histidine kinase